MRCSLCTVSLARCQSLFLSRQPGDSAVCKHPPHVLTCGSSLERDFDTFVDQAPPPPCLYTPSRESCSTKSKSILDDRLRRVQCGIIANMPGNHWLTIELAPSLGDLESSGLLKIPTAIRFGARKAFPEIPRSMQSHTQSQDIERQSSQHHSILLCVRSAAYGVILLLNHGPTINASSYPIGRISSRSFQG